MPNPQNEPDLHENHGGTARLILTAFAPLHVVAAANYLRYGARGVRRFGPGQPSEASQAPSEIKVNLKIKTPDDTLRLDYAKLWLSTHEKHSSYGLDGVHIWDGHIENTRLHLAWAWDFYRMYSGVKLALPVPTDDPAPEWLNAYATLQSLQIGDRIILEAHSPAGDILQIYPIDQPARLENP